MTLPRSARRAAIGVLLLAIDLHAQQTRVVRPARPEVAPAGSTGTAAITGVVVDASTSRPIGGAVVTLEERTAGRSTFASAQVTTPTGRFAFVDLAASDRYVLTSAKPGYLDGGYQRADPRSPGAPIASPTASGSAISACRCRDQVPSAEPSWTNAANPSSARTSACFRWY